MLNLAGRLKTRDWKTRDHQKCRGGNRGTGKRGTVSKGVENEGPKCRGGKRSTGKHGTIIPGVENATSSYGKPKLQVYLVISRENDNVIQVKLSQITAQSEHPLCRV